MEFDWYSATLSNSDPSEVLASVVEGLDLVDVIPSRPLNGYQRAAKVQRGSEVLSVVQWGGNAGSVHAYASSAAAPRLAEVMRGKYPEHRVTRADVREDYNGQGAWGDLYPVVLEIAKEAKVQTRYIGPPPGEESEDLGKTLYVGSRKSPVQLRLYEKGKQLKEYGKPNWVRLELMVLPAKVEARERFSRAVPSEFFGASRWSKLLFERVSGCEIARMCAGTVYKKEDLERSMYWLTSQYGAVLSQMADKLGGWAALGPDLEKRVLQQTEEKRRAA